MKISRTEKIIASAVLAFYCGEVVRSAPSTASIVGPLAAVAIVFMLQQEIKGMAGGVALHARWHQ